MEFSDKVDITICLILGDARDNIRSEYVFYFWYNLNIPMELDISYFLGTIAAVCRKNEWWRFGGEVEKIWQCSYNHKAGNYVANTNYIAIFFIFDIGYILYSTIDSSWNCEIV